MKYTKAQFKRLLEIKETGTCSRKGNIGCALKKKYFHKDYCEPLTAYCSSIYQASKEVQQIIKVKAANIIREML